MPWFQVDDQLSFHAKVVAAGNPAMGLWVRAGSWCAQQITEGYIPKDIAKAMGTPAQIKKLLDVALWTEDKSGYRFHQWGERQMSKEEIEARRQKRIEAGRAGGKASGHSRRDKSERSKQGSKTEASASASAEPSAQANTNDSRTPVLVPVLEGSTYVDPEPHVSQRAGKPRGRERIDEINGTAHSPQAHSIAKRYADSCRQPPPGNTIRGVALAADGCLRSGYTDHQIEAGIQAWEASTFTSTSKIPDFVHQTVNRTNNAGPQNISKAEGWLNLGHQLDDHDRKAIEQ